MIGPQLSVLAHTAMKVENKQPEYLARRIEAAKENRSKVYFMGIWFRVSDAELLLSYMYAYNAKL
jgi:hypothetical protein